ncbi:Subtilisin-like protease [Hordeum vulgare]|nr:Subtilisin-like protease [Hordeum vulgare]
MVDPPPNSGDPVVVPATKAKNKKAPKGTKKPRSELTPKEIAKLDVESAKRRNRRAEAKRKDIAAAIERAALEQFLGYYDLKGKGLKLTSTFNPTSPGVTAPYEEENMKVEDASTDISGDYE